MDGVRRGWFGEARSLKAEKLDFAKLRTQEMWPSSSGARATGRWRPLSASRRVVGGPDPDQHRPKRARGQGGAEREARGHAAKWPRGRVRGSSVAYATGPHLDEFMEDAAAREDARRDAVRAARASLRATVRATTVEATRAARSFEDELNAERADVEAPRR